MDVYNVTQNPLIRQMNLNFIHRKRVEPRRHFDVDKTKYLAVITTEKVL